MTVCWWDVWTFLDVHACGLLAVRDGGSWRWEEKEAGGFDPGASAGTPAPRLPMLVAITTAWRPGRNTGTLYGSFCPHT